MKRFASWCIQAGGWWYWRFELSFLAATHIGAKQLEKSSVLNWSEPIYDAFIAGAWLLHWADDTLFWVAKPDVHTERVNNQKRLHNANGPAIRSDVENIYFWHGVLVPDFVVEHPESIQLKHIESESNAEVRRIMIERYGLARYLMDSDSKEIHRDDFGILYRKDIPGDEPLVMVKVVNSTPEPNGSFKDYFLRVHPECRPILRIDSEKVGRLLGDPQPLTARNAVASTFGLRGENYQPLIET